MNKYYMILFIYIFFRFRLEMHIQYISSSATEQSGPLFTNL